MNNNHKWTLVIQAGGESRRMGEDKALKEFRGESLVQRLVKRLKPLGKEIILIVRHPAEYAFLGLPIYTDIRPGVGALGGLYTALSVADTPFVAMIACDMPFVNPELLLYQWSLIRENSFDVVVPVHEEKLQPFHGIYRVSTCLPAVRDAIEKGQQKVVSWLDTVLTYRIPTAESDQFDPLHLAFLNLNTPDDFRLAEELARKGNA
jgi:molybdopterin-guanine dinucleotide biosynthesis protein A